MLLSFLPIWRLPRRFLMASAKFRLSVTFSCVIIICYVARRFKEQSDVRV